MRALGIDVGVRKGLHLVALDARLRPLFTRSGASLAELPGICQKIKPDVVAIDSQPCWAICGNSRLAERDLQSRRVHLFATPSDTEKRRREFYDYDVARQLDTSCVKAICDEDIAKMTLEEACGRTPVLTLLHLARQKGWKAKLLDQRNSGDTAGNKERVVGYAAIAFYAPEKQTFATEERRQLLVLARQALQGVVTQTPILEPGPDTLAQKFTEPKGCFVTLTTNGVLRGCIGDILPRQPLYKAIIENTQSAARRDPRFSPVQPDELDKIGIEISVLTMPEPLPFSSVRRLLAVRKQRERRMAATRNDSRPTFKMVSSSQFLRVEADPQWSMAHPKL
jgi:AmmeMemoRadiSam system protein A